MSNIQVGARLEDLVGCYVRKKSGSWWEGYIVGTYSTKQTLEGVNVQLPIDNGPVQIYPINALEYADPDNRAKIIAKWLGYDWNSLYEGSTVERGFPIFHYHSQFGWKFQGRKDDLRKLVHDLLQNLPLEV